MNEEILSGLKMALERGFKLEESAQSFINAGYNVSEVREAASFISKGISPLPSLPKESAVAASKEPKPLEGIQAPPQASKKTKWIIWILITLILLAIIIPIFVFKNKILGVIG